MDLMAFGITGWGTYIPRFRLERGAVASTHAWMAPSLKGLAKGRRAFCSWDEDVVTMAVEAARECLGAKDRAGIAEIRLVSTTSSFADLQSSALTAASLQLSPGVRALDIGGSHRAGVAALGSTLENAARPTLVIASERLRAKPASVQEMQYGAGAAAFTVGSENVAAELLGVASNTTLFVDHFRASAEPYDYYWEERWIRDEGYLKLGAGNIRAALKAAKVEAKDVAKLIFPAPGKGVGAAVAKAAGVPDAAVADALDADGGYAGTAHALLMLADALDKAKPGDVIVVAGFAQGADTIVLRATDAITSARPKHTLADVIAAGVSVSSYAQYASFYDEIDPDRGMRAERDMKTALTEQYRSSDQVSGFLAGKCPSCGQVQFPQLSYCVVCNAPAKTFEQFSLADESAKVVTFSADGLMYYPNPPLYVGFAQFDVGARLLMEFVDVVPETFGVGTKLRMVLRIKEHDSQRIYERYFWKAAQVR
jgi:3-hydroxy-3-methylglutaryl CoA synthase